MRSSISARLIKQQAFNYPSLETQNPPMAGFVF
jgi:hypothetical protein